MAKVVSNKQVILPKFVNGIPKESDLVLQTGSISLELPEGSKAVLVKNLILSCDPYMRSRMEKIDDPNYYVQSYTLGQVLSSIITTSCFLVFCFGS